jgi:hypothetical protein
MIKIEEKKVKVLFAKGENGTIAISVKGNNVIFEPLTDYIEVGTTKIPKEIIGEKMVSLEFGNTDSIDCLIKALTFVKANIERAKNPIPFAC